jgi:hypothetical protein
MHVLIERHTGRRSIGRSTECDERLFEKVRRGHLASTGVARGRRDQESTRCAGDGAREREQLGRDARAHWSGLEHVFVDETEIAFRIIFIALTLSKFNIACMIGAAGIGYKMTADA